MVKTVIMTNIPELDKTLQKQIKYSQVAIYSNYFLEDPNINIAIISPNIKTNISFQNFLFEIRKRNIRVILLLDDTNSKYLGYALALGIYDIVFDPISTETILVKLQYPTTFSEISQLYVGKKGDILFENCIEEKKYKNSYKKNINCIDNMEKETLKNQLLNLFKLFNISNSIVNKTNLAESSLPELVALLEQLIIDKVIKERR